MSAALLAQVVALTLSVGAGSFAVSGNEIRESRGELAAALSGCRFTTGRLVAFRYAAGAETVSPCPSSPRLARITRKVELEAEKDPTAPALGNLAVLRLAAGEPHQAVELLKTATEKDEGNASLLSDLAVAYVEAAGRDEPVNLVHAVGSAQRALELDNSHEEAKFNYALALDRLYPSELAPEAWEAFLDLDGRSGWAAEARERVERLRQPTDAELWREAVVRLDDAARRGEQENVLEIVERFPQPARLHTEEELLPTWGSLVEQGKYSEAEEVLATARVIGAALMDFSGDSMVADSVAVIDRATIADRTILATGHRTFAEGLATLRSDQPGAEALLHVSRTALASARSPFAGWSDYHLAVCAFGPGDHVRAVTLLPPVQSRYASLAAKSLWLRGLMQVGRGELDESLLLYRSALHIAQGARDPATVAALHNLIAENFRFLGDHRRSWASMALALKGSPRVTDPTRVQVILQETAEQSLAVGEPGVALVFQGERMRRLDPSLGPTYLALALYEGALFRDRMRDTAGAASDLRLGFEAAARIQDDAERQVVLGYLLAARGRLLRNVSPVASLAAITEAISTFERKDDRRALPGLLLDRALTSVLAGGHELARQDLRAAMAEIERQVHGVADGTLRISFLDQAQAVLRQLVRFELAGGDTERAFAVADRLRSSSMAQLLTAGVSPAPDRLLADLQPRLGPDAALIEYLVLDDHLITWVVRRDGMSHVEQAISGSELDAAVHDLLRDIEAGWTGQEDGSAARELYRLLVSPIADRLAGVRALVVVPDGVLHKVPFASLVDPSSSRYLVEDFDVAKTPSATVFATIGGRGADPLGRSEPYLLIVGNPPLDRERFAWLEPLPGADRETERIAEIFPGAVPLVGAKATKEAFRLMAGDYEVVHFAGHALVNRRRPERSGLVFASEIDASPVLHADEIERLELPRVRLVVLSACGTADGELSASEGTLSVGKAFLVAGVPMAIASLWRVDDDGTADLLARFYKHLKSGRPAGALRAAQLELIGRGERPRTWAAFELLSRTSLDH